MDKLELTISKLVQYESELGDLCKGHYAFEDDNTYTPQFKYCEAADLYGRYNIKCKYLSKNMMEDYCLCNK